MYIYDFSCVYDDGRHPTVTMKLTDVNVEDMIRIRRLASTGDKIRLEIDDSWNNWISSALAKAKERYSSIKVTKVIYHNPATIVFWSDGTKTVVKCGKGDTYDKEKGFYIACAKKLFGNDYKAVGRMNKALEMAVTQTKLERMTMDDILLPEEDKNG